MPSRGRRRLLVAGIVLGVLAGCVLWLALRGLAARSHLNQARADLAAVRADLDRGDTAAALAQLTKVREQARQAHGLTHDPVWFVAEHLPWIGTPLRTGQGITDAVDDLSARGLAILTSVADDLRPSRLRSGPDTVDVALLARTASPLRAAADDLATQQRRIADLPASWLGSVARARTDLLGQLTLLSRRADQAARAATVAPAMLGLDGPRRYFVGFQNTAEARGTGGLLGAFAIVTADHGRVHVERTGSDADLPPITRAPARLPAEFVRRYQSVGSDRLWVNTNIDPHFPYVAATWAGLWRQTTGQTLDGALALDPTALADVMQATGPVDVAGLGTVTADRVVPLVGEEEYRLFPDTTARKAAMVRLARAVIDGVLGGRGDPHALMERLGAAVAGGHLLVASEHPEEEALLEAAGVAGAIPQTSAPFVAAVVSNASGTKLDWYADQSLAYRVDSCSAQARQVTITVTLTNGAPRAGLPPYVSIGTVGPVSRHTPNTNRVYLQVFTGAASVLRAGTIDGRPVATVTAPGLSPQQPQLSGSGGTVGADAERGHVVFWSYLDVAPGQTRTVALHLDEPRAAGPPVVWRQDTARPWTAVVEPGTCR